MSGPAEVVTDPGEPIGLRPFSLDAVAGLLRGGDIPAFVAHTGGGIATLVAGLTGDDQPDGLRYPAVAGPGTYGGAAGDSVAVLTDFWVGPDVGPDDDGEDTAIGADAAGARTIGDLARLIALQTQCPPGAVPDPDVLAAHGFDPHGRSPSPQVAAANARAARWADTWNTALNAAYAAGASPDEAVAAAQHAVDQLADGPTSDT